MLILVLSTVGAYLKSNTAVVPVAVNVWLSVNDVNRPSFAILSNFTFSSKLLVVPSPKYATATALSVDAPLPPTRFTVGIEVYPLPLLSMRTPVTLPLDINAWAVAPDPLPSITTLGGLVYPLPPLAITISVIL